jgi:hypothetical protein
MTFSHMVGQLAQQRTNEMLEAAEQRRRAAVDSSARRPADEAATAEGTTRRNLHTRVLWQAFADGFGGRLLKAVIQPEVLAVLRSDHQTLQTESLQFFETEIDRAYLTLGPPPSLENSLREGRLGDDRN